MVRKSTISKVIDFLNIVKNSGCKSVHEYCEYYNLSNSDYTGWAGRIRKILDSTNVPENLREEANTVAVLKDSLKNNHGYTNKSVESQNCLNSVITNDNFEDDRIKTEIVRDPNGKIIGYRYDIKKKTGGNLVGTLNRSEMERLVSLYSTYGANLTAAQVSLEFPTLALADFQRIRTAFLVYKYSCPFAPHIVDENTEDQLHDMAITLKTSTITRKLEKNQLKDAEKIYIELGKENEELKRQVQTLSKDFNIDITGLPKIANTPVYIDNPEKVLMLHLADLHIGACVESGALYENNWNEEEIINRLTSVLNQINNLGEFDEIIVNMLGDNLDGMDGQTARRDHFMPQNMDNKQQFNTFIKVMTWFYTQLQDICSNIRIYSVPEGNHDGDFGYLATVCLQSIINHNLYIPFFIFDKFLGSYDYKNETFILCHGKDASFMKAPLPLILNDKTTVWLNNWMDRNNITNYGHIHIIKGDLHSSALQSNAKFTYRNVLSLFGDSDYSQMNYVSNSRGISYELFINDQMVSGTFEV